MKHYRIAIAATACLASLMTAACGGGGGAKPAVKEAYCRGAPSATCSAMIAAASKHVGGGARLDAYLRSEVNFDGDLTDKQKAKIVETLGEITSDDKKAAKMASAEAAVKDSFVCSAQGNPMEIPLTFDGKGGYKTIEGWLPQAIGEYEVQENGSVLFRHPAGQYAAGTEFMAGPIAFEFQYDDGFRRTYDKAELNNLGGQIDCVRK